MKNRESIKDKVLRYIKEDKTGLYIWIGIWTILCITGAITFAPAIFNGHILIAIVMSVLLWIAGVVSLMVGSVTPF